MKKEKLKKLFKGKVSLVDILGLASFVVAAFIWTVIAGFIVLGVALITLSYFAEDE